MDHTAHACSRTALLHAPLALVETYELHCTLLCWYVPSALVIHFSNFDTLAAYLVLIVIVVYFHPLEGMPPRGDVYLAHWSPDFISTFPVQVFAFTCAQNVRLS